MKNFIRVLSSNFRATRQSGGIFSGDSFPIWADGDEYNWRYQWASFYLYHIYGYELPLHNSKTNVVTNFPTQSIAA